MSSLQTTSLIKANKNFIVGYFQSKYHSNAFSFMSNKRDELKRATHGAAHICISPSNAAELFKQGIKADHYYYVTQSTIRYGKSGEVKEWYFSLRSDLLDCISMSEVPFENYHFLILLDETYADVTYSELRGLEHTQMLNQKNQVCLLYSLKNFKFAPKATFKPKYTNLKYDKTNREAYYEPSFKPECIGNVSYAKSYCTGFYCIDVYDEDKETLRKDAIYKDVNLSKLWKWISNLQAKADCSSYAAFQNKVRKGRDVKMTNENNEVLYLRIRELEKRVETLEGEVKELKEFRDEAVRELKEVKAKVEEFNSLTQLDVATSLQSFKVLLYKYCIEGKNKLTKDIVEKEGYSDVFNYLLSKEVITRVPSDNYYFIHWNLLKAA